jgi:hypothetical protein
MNENSFYLSGSSIWGLQESIAKNSVQEISKFSTSRKDAVNAHLIAKIIGEPADDSVLAEPSHYGEFCFRVTQVLESLFEFERFPNDFDRIPIRGLSLGPSEQIKMFFRYYIDSVYVFQERLWKLYESAAPLATINSSLRNTEIKCQKKQFRLQFLSPLKSIVDLRDAWVHDQPIVDERLSRLSSLELWMTINGISQNLPTRTGPLKRQHQQLMKEIRTEYSDICRKNSTTCVDLADIVVDYILKDITLPHG